MIAERQYNIFRFMRRFIFSYCYKSFFLPSSLRIKLLRLTGIEIGKNCFIGQFVLFDDLYPNRIHIGDNVTITAGTKIITHFFNPDIKKFEVGDVYIKSNTFIGMNTIITKPVSIGPHVCIGAASVITKDLPENSICVGTPCKVIKEWV